MQSATPNDGVDGRFNDDETQKSFEKSNSNFDVALGMWLLFASIWMKIED